MTHGETWHLFTAGEPITCPARTRDGDVCGRPQDRVGPESSYRVRVRVPGDRVSAGSLERVCRNTNCNARLEVQPCPTTPAPRMVTR